MIRLFVMIPALQELFACSFTADASLEANLILFAEMNKPLLTGRLRFDRNTVVIERESGTVCSLNMTLRAQGLQDGMTIIIY